MLREKFCEQTEAFKDEISFDGHRYELRGMSESFEVTDVFRRAIAGMEDQW